VCIRGWMSPVGRSEPASCPEGIQAGGDWYSEGAAPWASAPARTYIYRYLGVGRSGVLRVGLGRRRWFDRGRLFFRFVGGWPTGEEALDHVKGDGNEEDGDG
jgi:hypothetical protein